MFWFVSFCFGAFGTVSLLHKTCCKTRQTGEINAKVRAIKSCRTFFATTLPIHWILNSCFGAFLSVWVHLEPFCYYTKLAAKRAKLLQLMQKFVPRSRVGIFHNDAPDPHHWTLNSCFGAFLSVWVHLEPFCYYTKLAAKHAKQVQLMQKFVPRCLVRIFRNEHS